MKKLLYIVTLLPIIAMAQSTDQNWVKSKTYKVPTTTSIATPTATEAVVQVNYYDGLGRPIQQVAHAQSNSGKDIVTHMEYDAFGRVEKEFLPYVNQSASLNINSSANTDVLGFYNNTAYENTQNPYSQKQFEASPLNRVFKQAAPGEAWKMTSGHEIEFDYYTNIADEVKKYKATATWNATKGLYEIAFVDAGYYTINELYKTITKDENHTSGNNNTTQEFKNKEGQVVLKRTFNNSDAHDTYYIYDQFGNLTYVIPPAVSGTIDQTKLDNMCYQYKYDYRNRLVEKKLPGKQWEYIVYDKLDRVVATGPAYNPYGATSENDKGWLLTKYDVLNRPVYTAWYNAAVASTADRKTLQASYNSATTYSENKTTSANTINGISTKYTNNVSPSTFILLTVNYYDTYDYPSAPTVPSTLPESTFPIATNVKGLPTGSWVRVLDVAGSTKSELSYTIYDEKFRPVRSYTKNYLGGYTQVDSKLDWAGKTEYTITKHKRTSNGIEVQTKDSFEYSNQDRLTKHYQQISGSSEQLISLNTYDELGQLTSKKVGGEDITGVNAFQNVDYSYNIRGWLKSINDVSELSENDLFAFKINYNQLESGSNTNALFNGNIAETLWRTSADNVKRKYEYQYDNLNRLLEANYYKPDVFNTLDNYLEKISYDKAGNILTLIRNGNLDPNGGITANQIDDLAFTYDGGNLNLLKRVHDLSNSPQGFNQNNDIAIGDIDGLDNKDLTDDYTYDFNGNLKTDVNKGISEIIYNHLNLPIYIQFDGTTNGTISYIYNAVGQKVKKVVNEGSPINTDYLSGFQYEDAILQFFPHAEGYVKATGSTDRNGAIQYYYYNYVFNYTDHLGNIRVSYAFDSDTQGLKILEENHYYPFGLKHKNYNIDKLDFGNFPETGVEIVPTENPMYKYKYNGKELQDELGLNWLDYGWRNYDPAISRWVNFDPLLNDLDFAFDDSDVDEDDDEEVFEALVTKIETGGGIYNPDNLNPYGYGYNNPVSFDDPDGRCPLCYFIGLYLYTEIAHAPTRDAEGDAKSVKEFKNLQQTQLSLAIPGVRNPNSSASTISNIAKKKVANKAQEELIKKAQARAEKLSKTQRPGKDFTKAGKEAVKDLNKAKNGGKTKCETCGTKTKPATQSKKGVKPSKKEAQVDHKKAKSKGGSGTPDNGQVLCRDCNIKKSDK